MFPFWCCSELGTSSGYIAWYSKHNEFSPYANPSDPRWGLDFWVLSLDGSEGFLYKSFSFSSQSERDSFDCLSIHQEILSLIYKLFFDFKHKSDKRYVFVSADFSYVKSSASFYGCGVDGWVTVTYKKKCCVCS